MLAFRLAASLAAMRLLFSFCFKYTGFEERVNPVALGWLLQDV